MCLLKLGLLLLPIFRMDEAVIQRSVSLHAGKKEAAKDPLRGGAYSSEAKKGAEGRPRVAAKCRSRASRTISRKVGKGRTTCAALQMVRTSTSTEPKVDGGLT